MEREKERERKEEKRVISAPQDRQVDRQDVGAKATPSHLDAGRCSGLPLSSAKTRPAMVDAQDRRQAGRTRLLRPFSAVV